jgi:hypothetical protein
MHTIRDFARRLSYFKRLASAGKRIELVDGQGKRFIFEAQKPKSAYGAGKHLTAGKPLSPKRTRREEWKGLE